MAPCMIKSFNLPLLTAFSVFSPRPTYSTNQPQIKWSTHGKNKCIACVHCLTKSMNISAIATTPTHMYKLRDLACYISVSSFLAL